VQRISLSPVLGELGLGQSPVGPPVSWPVFFLSRLSSQDNKNRATITTGPHMRIPRTTSTGKMRKNSSIEGARRNIATIKTHNASQSARTCEDLETMEELMRALRAQFNSQHVTSSS